MTILKYTLELNDLQEIQMPKSATILSCQKQFSDCISIWVMADPDAELETRIFEIIGTGRKIPQLPNKYISTVIVDRFVWHVFEITNTP